MSTTNRKPIIKRLVIAALFGVFLYSGVYIYARNSDAFIFAKQQIQHSSQIKSQVGEIKSIDLPVFGGFHEKTSGSDTHAAFQVKVKGTRGSVLISINVEKKHGSWSIMSADIDGTPVSLQK